MSKYIEMNVPAPRRQGIAALALGLTMMLGGLAFARSPLFPWLVAGACLLLYTVATNLLSIFSDHFGKYFQESLVTFVVLMLALSLPAYLISGLGIRQAGTYRTIFIVLIMAFFVLAALSRLVRNGVDFLLRKDKKKGM